MSRFLKIVKWLVRIAILILVLVLVLNNMQHVEFNFYGIYTWNMPLIVLALIFLVIGLLIGLIYGLIRSIEYRTRIKLLRNDLAEAKKANPASSETV